jgi:hypothetical protein
MAAPFAHTTVEMAVEVVLLVTRIPFGQVLTKQGLFDWY